MTVPHEGPHARSVRLVEAIRGGDAGAWEELIDAYGSLVLAAAQTHGLSEAEAQDVFQETWASLLTQIHTLRQPQSLVRWIAQTAARQSRFALRGRLRYADVDAAAPATEPSPLEDLAALEIGALVREQASELDEPCRSLLRALFFEEVPPGYRRLAERLGQSRGSMGSARRRCLEALGQRLERRGLR